MGFLDRDYYRDEEGGAMAAWVRQGLVSKILVAIFAVVYLVQISSHGGAPDTLGVFTEALDLVGDKVLGGEFWRLLTYGFLHPLDSLLPILFNVPLIYVVGREIEERLGSRRYLVFVLTAIVVGGMVFIGAMQLGLRGASMDKTHVFGPTVAITAMLAFLTVQSHRTRLTFFYSLSVPVWVLLIATVAIDAVCLLWPLANKDSFSGRASLWPDVPLRDLRRITLAGHLGGLLFGAAFQLLMRQLNVRLPMRRSRPATTPYPRIYDDPPEPEEDEEQPAPVPATSDLDEHLEAQLDAVLAKVAANGQESLTGAERDILRRASEVYRKRRR